ncbi:MAG: hypothetical protein FWH17_10615 [Oscillospiraceae bacterium]|nr:hypothetical protein [Oscillospiraceae bacterium]
MKMCEKCKKFYEPKAKKCRKCGRVLRDCTAKELKLLKKENQDDEVLEIVKLFALLD